MGEQNNPKLLMVTLITGIVFIVMFAMFLLVAIWMPKSNNSSKTPDESAAIQTGSLGTYKTYSYTQENMISSYINKVTSMLLNKNTYSLNLMANKGYAKYFNIDETKLKKILDDKKLLGQFLNSTKYEYNNIDGNNIYIASVNTPNNLISDSVIITEYSPNDIAISFDDFISYEDTLKEYVSDGVKLELLNKTYFTTKVDMTVRLSNSTADSVIMNRTKMYENIYLRFKDGTEARTTTVVVAGETKSVDPGQILNFKLSFDIPKLSESNIDSLVIKDVYFTKTGLVKDVEYKM